MGSEASHGQGSGLESGADTCWPSLIAVGNLGFCAYSKITRDSSLKLRCCPHGMGTTELGC